jgi:hypothetical protein
MMDVQIEAEAKEKPVVLRVEVDNDFLLTEERGEQRLASELIRRYLEQLAAASNPSDAGSCTVKLRSPLVGSALVRALFKLWREVRKHKGTLTIADYPEAYLHSLISLGLTQLPDFKLAKPPAESRG